MSGIYGEYSRIKEIKEWTEQQIKISNREREFWFKHFATSSKFPTLASMSNVDRLSDNIEQLHEVHDFYNGIAKEIEQSIRSLKGLEHEVAYKRIVEEKTLAEIATELNFSPEYIRRVNARIKKGMAQNVVIRGYKEDTKKA